METKRAKVIMLPTEESKLIQMNNTKDLHYCNILKTKQQCISCNHTAQNLYITTDDEIKEGDWYVSYGVENKSITGNIIPKQIIKADLNKTNEFLIEPWNKYCKKIIATTDNLISGEEHDDSVPYPKMRSIYLPKPSQEFIKKYCKVGGIDEVLVEYDIFYRKINDIRNEIVYKSKIDSHNTITIHPIKDSWNREEVVGLCKLSFNRGELYEKLSTSKHGYSKEYSFNTWIKENL